MKVFSKDNYGGSYIHYGVREHGMAAAMNGIALHGGAIPTAQRFLFLPIIADPRSDYRL